MGDRVNVYFAGSIRGGRADAALYAALIAHLRKHGRVFTEHVGAGETDGNGETGLSDHGIHDRDMGWLRAADVVVAEVTVPSLGVGYEIGRALEEGKRVICLHRPAAGKRLSAMIAGSSGLTVVSYRELADATAALDDFLSNTEPGSSPNPGTAGR
jgi:hypothetical protein